MNSGSSSVALEHASLAAAVEQAADSIVVTDISGKIQYVNPAFTAMTGYSAEEAVGRNPRILKSGLHSKAFYKELWETILSGQVWQGKLTNRRKNGTIYYEEMRVAPVLGSNGEIVSFIAVKRDITERRAGEESQAFLAAIVENSEDSIIACTPEGTIRAFNRGAEAVFGYPAQEVIGQHMSLLVPPERSTALEHLAEKLRKGERFSQYEGFCLRKDGGKIEVCVTGFPIRNSDGEVIAISNILRDITERKQTERQLRESEKLFRAIFEDAPVGMYVAGPDGRIIQVNEAACGMLGYSEREMLAKFWPDLCHPDDMADAMRRKRQLLHCGAKIAEAERRFFHRNGTVVWCQITISLLGTGEGIPPCSVVHMVDITERKRAEQALRESEERFRALADSSPSLMWVTNSEGRVEFVNQALRDLCGVTREEVEAGQWSLPLHPGDAADYRAAFNCAARDHAPFNAEARVRRADGEWRLVGTRAQPRFSPGGDYVGHTGLSADISDRVRAERAHQFRHSLLRTIYEVSLDGILVVDADGIVVTHNKRFLDVWQIQPSDISESPVSISDQPVLLAVLERVTDPVAFSARVRELYVHPEENDQCEIALKDGRTLERYSTSLRNDAGEYLARAWFFRDITERKRAEQAMLESENRFRIMADSCPIGIWVTDAQGAMLFMNRTYRSFFGDACEDLQQDSWQLTLHTEDAPAFFHSFAQTLKDHASFKAECRCRRADGEWRWVETFADPRFSQEKEFLGLVGTSKDITERRQVEADLAQAREAAEAANRGLSAQHALLENERRILRSFMENIPDFMYVKDTESRFVVANAALAEWAGVNKPEEMLGKTDFDFYPDEVARGFYEDEQRVIRSGQPIFNKEETSCSGAASETAYWLTTKVPLFDSDGRVTGVAGVGRDISARKRVEAELVRAREDAEASNRLLSAQNAVLNSERQMLRALIDNIPDLMWVKDAESRFVVANREVARFNGMEKPDELLGKTDFDFFPPEIAIGFHEEEQSVIRSGQPMVDREETSSDSVTGEIRYCLSTKVPLFDGEGRTAGIAGIGRVITERKKAENALRESNRQLQEATVRANELALEAASANQAKSEFLANMSHEIRTPMNGVLGMTGMLLGSDLGAEQRHWAEVVEACAKSLLTVIDDILDFSKIEAGKLEIDIVDFNLRVLMDDFAEMMAGRIGEKPLEFVCAVAPDVSALLKGDPGRLRQVLLNLASNAFKFTHQGEVVIRVTLIAESETGVSLRFTARDTGIGIPASKLKMLFSSFTQVDASTTRQYGGTGLGLAISKQLVELMGGSIGVESQEGVGSEFWFTIRLAKQDAEKQEDVPTVSMQDLRILVVDDNAANREVLTAQLQSWGADVTAVQDGPAALACLRDAIAAGKQFQLVVLDMMMPGMDGETLGIEILADEALKKTPLVMMTSMGQRGDAQHFKEIGFSAYLIKPVRQSDLLDCLTKVLTGKRHDKSRSLVTRHSLREVRRSNVRILLAEDNLT
ncbi:MAG: PAS domain S-box protein, partial [Terracidiphilus sp.]